MDYRGKDSFGQHSYRSDDISSERHIALNGFMSHHEGIRQRREALLRFYDAHKDALRNPHAWAKASSISYSALAEYMTGNKEKNLRSDTYAKLAIGAGVLLGRPVGVAELIGEINEEETITEIVELMKLLSPEDRERHLEYLRGDVARMRRSASGS